MNSRYICFLEKHKYDTFCFEIFTVLQSAGYPKKDQFKLCLETDFHFK